jgi:GNAT superfamily N-acetyltransferase
VAAQAELVIAPVDIRDAVCQDLLVQYEEDIAARMKPGFELAKAAPPGPHDFDPPEGIFYLCRLTGEAVACGGLRTIGDGIGEIRRMYVVPRARGAGIGRELLSVLEQAARERQLHTIRLDTAEELDEAQRLYQRAGFEEIPDYNGNIFAARWYEKRLT